MKQALNDFYKELESLRTIGNDVGDKRKEIEKEVSIFKNNVDGMNINQMGFKSQEIQENFNKHLDSIKNKISKWEKDFQKLSKEEEFRDSLKNSFIVIIYGKVKAGKSTLGNFVASNCLENQKPHFIVYDKAGHEDTAEQLNEFKTNITECTSSIQLFTLGDKHKGCGIAWVDTPGLLSMTKENGDLAKKYIEAADYIIFPTSSDAPLQNDEIEQIRNLVNSGKNSCIRLLITKSDQTTEDEEEGKIITITSNKSKENRKKQEEDIFNRIKEAIPNLQLDEEILSISVLTAKKALEDNNEELFKGSNIIKFYESMNLILKEKALRLKQESPFKRLQGFLEGILGKSQHSVNLERIRNDYNELKNLVEEKKRLNKAIKENLKNEASIIISEELIKEEKNLNENNAKQIFDRIQDNIKNKIEEKIQEEACALMDDFIARFNIIAPTLDTKVEAVYTQVKQYVKRSFFEKFVNTVTLGTFCKEKSYTESIKIGTNRAEIVEKNRPLLQEYCNELIEYSSNKIIEEILQPCENMVICLYESIDKLENNLKKIKATLN
ncbi:50S ribosome-binding GTPase [Campylobacter jejuni]|nr:50S ribosome-binding GTPase [Campylobacter jejuni]